MYVFQVGDLVEYNSSNRWVKQRNWIPDKGKAGIILDVTSYDDEHQAGVRVRWGSGEEKVYFEEELGLLSSTADDNSQSTQ